MNKQRMRFFAKGLQQSVTLMALCGMLGASLQGCVGIAIGAGVVGTMVATDRRTLGAQTEDKTIGLKGETRLNNLVGDAGHVNVHSFNRKVLLTGEVRDEAMKTAVGQEMANVENVQSVVNELAVSGIASLTSRSNDALITGKVKASLVDARDISATSFKVITERGIVYLMGRVTDREGASAADIARGVGGVQKVVKVFEYIDEEERKKMANSEQKK